ncbi:agmatinase [Nocardia concava]|uniref:agmatinase n=1 Tax=Nocardia concava TaxID=257281 RepID=UPI0012FAF817|nr:agmatinase [Nocardia concava]
MQSYHFLKIPYEEGAYWRKGAKSGPDAILAQLRKVRNQSIADGTSLPGGFSAVPVREIEHSPYSKSGYLELIETVVGECVAGGYTPVVLGGDHAITLPVVRAMAHHFGERHFGIIHIDAHSDTFPPVDGYRYHHGAVFRNIVEEGLVDPISIHQIGIRGLCGEGWLSFAEESGINLVHMERFREKSCDITHFVTDRSMPYYISIDIDAVDPAFAPGTGTPVPGGFTSSEILTLVRMLGTFSVIGFDLVEVAPIYDAADITSLLAAHIVAELMISADRPGEVI